MYPSAGINAAAVAAAAARHPVSNDGVSVISNDDNDNVYLQRAGSRRRVVTHTHTRAHAYCRRRVASPQSV